MTLSDLVDWECKDVRSLLENLSNRPTSRGGNSSGTEGSSNYKPYHGS